MIQELAGFYLVDGRLLFIHQDFIGFAPQILLNFTMPSSIWGQTVEEQHSFQYNEDYYQLKASFFKGMSLLRSHARIEVLKNNNPLLSYEQGGSYFIQYEKGSPVYINTKEALVLTKGSALKDTRSGYIYNNLPEHRRYLLHFGNIALKKKNPTVHCSTVHINETSTPQELLPYRTDWEATIQDNDRHIKVLGSTLQHHKRLFDNKTGKLQYNLPKGAASLQQIAIYTDSELYIRQIL